MTTLEILKKTKAAWSQINNASAQEKNALLLAKITHVITLCIFFYLGQLLSLGYMYYIGVGIAGGVLYFQHQIIAQRGFKAFNRRYYLRNGIVSVAIFLCTLMSVLWEVK